MKILILGCTGQDGSLLCESLLEENSTSNQYSLICPVRNIQNSKHKSYITKIFSQNNVEAVSCDYSSCAIENLIVETRPDVIVNFAAVSNVLNPWNSIEETVRINVGIPSTILEVLAKTRSKCKYIQASSSLVFGSGSVGICNELSPRSPLYPYGISKDATDTLIKASREKLGVNAASVIFFNHESERRPDYFLTRKVVLAAKRIAAGSSEILRLGDIDAHRDIGFARNFMTGVKSIIHENDNEDYVMGTGTLTSIKDIVRESFSYYGLNYENHVEIDKTLVRSQDTITISADTIKARNRLGWSPLKFSVIRLIEDEEMSRE